MRCSWQAAQWGQPGRLAAKAHERGKQQQPASPAQRPGAAFQSRAERATHLLDGQLVGAHVRRDRAQVLVHRLDDLVARARGEEQVEHLGAHLARERAPVAPHEVEALGLARPARRAAGAVLGIDDERRVPGKEEKQVRGRMGGREGTLVGARRVREADAAAAAGGITSKAAGARKGSRRRAAQGSARAVRCALLLLEEEHHLEDAVDLDLEALVEPVHLLLQGGGHAARLGQALGARVDHDRIRVAVDHLRPCFFKNGGWGKGGGWGSVACTDSLDSSRCWPKIAAPRARSPRPRRRCAGASRGRLCR